MSVKGTGGNPRRESAGENDTAAARTHIVLGVTGGIAAYKAAEIVRGLRQRGARVSVIMTEHSQEFITPLTLQTLSGENVITRHFPKDPRGEQPAPGAGPGSADIEHISLVRESDLLLVAPATANTIAKFAHGVADDFLSTFYTAYTGPVVIAPAMNTRMWSHPGVQENLATLAARGVQIVDPEPGELACGEEGMGRLASPAVIVERAFESARLGSAWEKERVLVTAGPTREPLDPVRFLTNRSSGKMGYAIAAAARRRGATVTLVTGPASIPVPWGVEVVRVETAEEMAAATLLRFDSCTVCIMSAAVSDYRAAKIEPVKIHRPAQEGKDSARASLTLELVPTLDILAAIGPRRGGRIVAGFAAQTGDPEPEARRKLSAKNVDYIFANDVTEPGAGFDVDTNVLVGFARDGTRREFAKASKFQQADRMLDWIDERRNRG